MVMMVPYHTVTVHRDGRNVRPRIGVPFDFTEEEVAFVTAAAERALRKPVNEMRDMTAAAVEKEPLRTDAPAPVRGRRPNAVKDDDEL